MGFSCEDIGGILHSAIEGHVSGAVPKGQYGYVSGAEPCAGASLDSSSGESDVHGDTHINGDTENTGDTDDTMTSLTANHAKSKRAYSMMVTIAVVLVT